MNIPLRLLFRIWYSGSFTFIGVLLLATIVVTPADLIRQALDHHQIYSVFIVAGAYLLTALLALLIYAARLYAARSALAAIPKTWVPVEKGDVSHTIHRLVSDDIHRSALIAWYARPRVEHVAEAPGAGNETGAGADDGGDLEVLSPMLSPRLQARRRERTATMATMADLDVAAASPPEWRDIAHPGWSSPFSPDLANVQYAAVIAELPHLIEAKAVSLAPTAPDVAGAGTALLDSGAIDVLQRPEPMGLRDYISYLANLGVVTDDAAAAAFLDTYEYARFADAPLTEPELRHLLQRFSDVLRGMAALDVALVSGSDSDSASIETDIDDDNSSKETSASERSRSIKSAASSARTRRSSSSSSTGTVRTAFSRRVATPGLSSLRQLGMTAPGTVAVTKRGAMSRAVSAGSGSFGRRRVVYERPSAASLRSVSSRSVIRLTEGTGMGEQPFTISAQ